MDKFKLVNDAHGLTGGNIALEHLAPTISSSLLAGDTVGR
jgi:GGDEF domain-containing protein